MIIAIDGPAGAGKSTTARAVAERFGFAYIDTGAMYRAVALAAMERSLIGDLNSDSSTRNHCASGESEIVALAQSLPLRFEENGARIFIGERDVSSHIRAPEIGALTSALSAIAGVRAVIVEQQRRLARDSEARCNGAVLEGRDIQTVVFPDAAVKIFLTADSSTRTARRLEQWQKNASHKQAQIEQAQNDIAQRDERDSTRAASPLKAADDAVVIETDSLSTDEVVEQIARLVHEKMKTNPTA